MPDTISVASPIDIQFSAFALKIKKSQKSKRERLRRRGDSPVELKKQEGIASK